MSGEQPQVQVCPWCDTEIVWDPEFGPEDECPNCFNELGSYRSVKLDASLPEQPGIRTGGGPQAARGAERTAAKRGRTPFDDIEDDDEAYEEDETDEASFDYDARDDGTEAFEEDRYAEAAMACIDEQEEAPECSYCHELMLLVGTRSEAPGFVAAVPRRIGKPLLPPRPEWNVYVCPSCFRSDSFLADRHRLALIETLRGWKE
ncbi:hypothetical protein [Paenibacillus cymbidii]|uniref:hypothetical protein n=1 Tax=Paenibacillus cymbidii TaxID=1639034 RepID=UPI001A9BB9E3|nr:hypothetical protein [Paenibacillus cymbidii]